MRWTRTVLWNGRAMACAAILVASLFPTSTRAEHVSGHDVGPSVTGPDAATVASPSSLRDVTPPPVLTAPRHAEQPSTSVAGPPGVLSQPHRAPESAARTVGQAPNVTLRVPVVLPRTGDAGAGFLEARVIACVGLAFSVLGVSVLRRKARGVSEPRG